MGLLVGVVVIVGALTFFPALSLGPIVEHFLMHGRTRHFEELPMCNHDSEIAESTGAASRRSADGSLSAAAPRSRRRPLFDPPIVAAQLATRSSS